MSVLELCNWYENRFPNDFAQLIKIKRFNISDLSFLLDKIWYKLNHGEKLLMCAVYNDDANLASQMLYEQRVNPFFGKRFFTQIAYKKCLSGSYGSSVFDLDEVMDFGSNGSNVFESNTPPKIAYCPLASLIESENGKKSEHKRHNSYYKESKQIVNASNRNRRTSLCASIMHVNNQSSFIMDKLTLANEIPFINPYVSLNESLACRKDVSPNQPTYYFDQLVCDFYMQTPLYFAIKQNKLRMCELFVHNLKSIYVGYVNKKLNRRKQVKETLMSSCYKNKRNTKLNVLLLSSKIWLNSFLDNSELIKLLVLALSNHNYQIAMLLLNNACNPSQILNFANLSESFIYTQEFCLFLVKKRIVEPRVMLKEATKRHAVATVSLILKHLEECSLHDKNTSLLFNAYKTIIDSSILACDLNLFRLFLPKLLLEQNHSFELNTFKQSHLTIEHILQLKHNHSMINKMRTNSFDPDVIDISFTKNSALAKNFDWDHYFEIAYTQHDSKNILLDNMCSSSRSSRSSSSKNNNNSNIESQVILKENTSSSLTYLNKLKLLNFIFNNLNDDDLSADIESNKESKILILESELEKLWSNFENSAKKKLTNYDKMFENSEATQTPKQTKRIHLCGYLILSDNEPFITNCLINNLKEDYKLTSGDLISVAKNGQSELTLHNLLLNLEFNSSHQTILLEPDDEVYGNFLEIIFCRLVRCNNQEQELRLRRLFFEAIILNNAKMTCSTNLLNLFLSNNHYVKQKLIEKYFPCLFYLSKSFNLFKNETHMKRFRMLVEWFAKNFLCIHEENLSEPKIDLILHEFCANKHKFIRQLNESSSRLKFDLRLKELARNTFAEVYLTNSASYNTFLNAINDSLRKFILYFNEMKSLF